MEKDVVDVLSKRPRVGSLSALPVVPSEFLELGWSEM